MTDDEDLLAPYDLSAWEPPPPPAGLVDAVIARAKEPAAAPAIELEREPRRWGWLVAGVAAVAAVGIAIGVRVLAPAPSGPAAPAHGEVSAEGPRSLSLGSTFATLDPGTTVRWHREGHRIVVEQPRGSATWNVDEGDTLVIDAGAMGASVEAKGARLRVEIEMNLADARVIAVSGVTATVVALVTVVVYEGHVNVTRGGQTVNVVPGSTYEIRPELELEAPANEPAAPRDPFVSSEEPTARTVQRELPGCDEVACVLSNWEGECCAKLRALAEGNCDAMASRTRGEELSNTGMHAAALEAFEESLACAPSPEVMRRAFMAACNSRNVAKAKQYYAGLSEQDRSRLSQICIRYGIALD
jgi:hypothetical protein